MTSPIVNWRNKKEEYQFLAKTGKIISFTKIFNPAMGFGKLPYFVAVVKLRNGQKKTGQLVLEGKKPKIGAPVKAIVRITNFPQPEEIINYGIKFKLV